MTDLNTLLLDAIDDNECNPLTAEAVDVALATCGLDDILNGDDHEPEDENIPDGRGDDCDFYQPAFTVVMAA